MSKFKIGDRVRVTALRNYHKPYMLGREGTVIEVSASPWVRFDEPTGFDGVQTPLAGWRDGYMECFSDEWLEPVGPQVDIRAAQDKAIAKVAKEMGVTNGGDPLLVVAVRNLRSYLSRAVFRSSADKRAAQTCVDVLAEAQSAEVKAVQATLDISKATLSSAETYAKRLATHLWKTHYSEESPEWEPVEDLMGLLSQIDNMVMGLARVEAKGAWHTIHVLMGIMHMRPLTVDEQYELRAAHATIRRQTERGDQ